MITDDERRAVAARLRELDYADLQESLICAYIDVLGIEGYADWVGIAHRIADLIEPSSKKESELCPHCDYLKFCDQKECSKQDGYSFKPKGYVELLTLADITLESAKTDMELHGDTVPSWYAAGRLEALAHAIREALEVHDD